MDRSYDVITFILRRAGVAIFADIINVVTIFIKVIFKDSRKVKRLRNYVSKCNPYLFFSYSKICSFPVKNSWCQQKSRGVWRDSYIFRTFFRKGITMPTFIIVGYVWQMLWREAFLAFPVLEQPRKSYPS